jgi:hypothetical protein
LLVFAVVMPLAEVLGFPAGAAAAAGLLAAAAGAELEPPDAPVLVPLLPQAARNATAATAPGAAHHRLRITMSPFNH